MMEDSYLDEMNASNADVKSSESDSPSVRSTTEDGITELSMLSFGREASGSRSRISSAYSDLICFSINSEEQEDLLQKYVGFLTLSISQLNAIADEFVAELKRGLECHKRHPFEWDEYECNFKMLDSMVRKLPTGNEKEVSYALDFGGTNYRTLRVELFGDGTFKRDQSKCTLKSSGIKNTKGLLDERSTATMLFDHFAIRLKHSMERSGDLPTTENETRKFKLGFTFSFPCQQTGLNSATLVEWTKGFETGRGTNDPVEGRDVGMLLNEALSRCNVPVSLEAITNDTVGTLLSCCYQKKPGTPDCLVGIILGTGTNGCYVEQHAQDYGYEGKIINVEYGNFKRGLPLTDIDLEIDFSTPNRNKQLFEKLIAGAYIGEICRLCVLKVFRSRCPPNAWLVDSWTSEDCASMADDETSDLSVTRGVLKRTWGSPKFHDIDILCDFDIEDLISIKKICTVVFYRSACLAAVAIYAMCRQTGRIDDGETSGVAVAVDGSLYTKNSLYREKLLETLNLLVGEKHAGSVVVISSDDGSGLGAAVLVAS